MEINTSNLHNGKIRLHSIYTDKFKMSRFSINFITKSDKYYTPLYKLMLSVMMRGSKKYPTITVLNKALDERYDTTVSFRHVRIGDKSIYKFSCKLLNQKYVFDGDSTRILDEVLDIISDMLHNPLRDEDGLLLSSYIESEKKIAIDAINSRMNDPKSYASEQCSVYMFDGSEYELYGRDITQIEGFTQKELTESIQRFFSEAQVECYYIGNESHDRVCALTEQTLKFMQNDRSDIEYGENAFQRKRTEVAFVEEDQDISQARLVLGYTCGTILSDEDYYAMALFNEIFGGGSVSKLFMNVREKKSLCYYCYSSLHSATGTIKVGCGIDPSKRDDAFEEITAQLDAMKRGEFTDSEIETARRTIISGVKQIYDSPSSMEAYALRRLLANVSDSPERSCERVMSVTKDDIIVAAGKVMLDTVYFMNGCEFCEEGEADE